MLGIGLALLLSGATSGVSSFALKVGTWLDLTGGGAGPWTVIALAVTLAALTAGCMWMLSHNDVGDDG
jgi:hypothetical protein